MEIEIGLGALMKCLYAEYEHEITIWPRTPSEFYIEIDSGGNGHGKCIFDITTNVAYDMPDEWVDIVNNWRAMIDDVHNNIDLASIEV